MAEKTLGQVAYEGMPSAMRIEWQYSPESVKAAWESVAAAVVAAHEAQRWQPIATAPKDGRAVHVGKWHRRKWQRKVTEFVAVAIEDGYTQWCPIPEPPKEADDAA